MLLCVNICWPKKEKRSGRRFLNKKYRLQSVCNRNLNIALKYISSYLIIFACLFVVQAHGQTFEYTENKGQWHQDVLFKGELSTGAFFLKKNGYRVLQHPPEELQAVKNALTGHGLENISPKAAAAIQASNINDGESGSGIEPVLTLRSHAYEIGRASCRERV